MAVLAGIGTLEHVRAHPVPVSGGQHFFRAPVRRSGRVGRALVGKSVAGGELVLVVAALGHDGGRIGDLLALRAGVVGANHLKKNERMDAALVGEHLLKGEEVVPDRPCEGCEGDVGRNVARSVCVGEGLNLGAVSGLDVIRRVFRTVVRGARVGLPSEG